MSTDHLIRRGLYVVTDPGTEAATLAVPFMEPPRPATEPEAATAAPEPIAADVLTALSSMEARLDLKLAALIDVVTSYGLDLDALAARIDRALPEPFMGQP